MEDVLAMVQRAVFGVRFYFHLGVFLLFSLPFFLPFFCCFSSYALLSLHKEWAKKNIVAIVASEKAISGLKKYRDDLAH